MHISNSRRDSVHKRFSPACYLFLVTRFKRLVVRRPRFTSHLYTVSSYGDRFIDLKPRVFPKKWKTTGRRSRSLAIGKNIVGVTSRTWKNCDASLSRRGFLRSLLNHQIKKKILPLCVSFLMLDMNLACGRSGPM